MTKKADDFLGGRGVKCPCGLPVLYYKEVDGDIYFYHEGDDITYDVCQMVRRRPKNPQNPQSRKHGDWVKERK